ncbi:YegJ family protein [Bradyrhizobium sp. 930_D9_N1_4]|uniref:YegJ family protein n=1 Tax=Bradyrhizobium sp. 930_D9_N1_4 TaxID=3240374 RepID=UPI003F8B6F94
MATQLSQPLKWIVLAAITGVSVFGILTIGPTHEVAAQDRSPIVDVRTSDPEMNTAIARARSTLPTFWASYQSPKPTEEGHSLKVRFHTAKGGEHIWIAEVKKLPSGAYSGFFANQPRDLPGKRAGDKVEFAEADISDWMFMRNGKIVGGETIKPTLKSLPKADADALRARMEQP